MQTEDQSTVKFIEIVKSNNILWDLKNPEYKNIKKKSAVWRSISEEFGLSTELCKRKWKGLRDSFSRVVNRKPTFDENTDEQECSWKHREQMEFIREHMGTRVSKGIFKPSITKTEDCGSNSLAALSPTAADDSFLFNSASPQLADSKLLELVNPTSSMSSQLGTKMEMVTKESSFLSTLEVFQDFLKKSSQEVPVPSGPDEDDLFCQSLLQKIKKFPRDLKNQAKLEMLRYLNEVENTLPIN